MRVRTRLTAAAAAAVIALTSAACGNDDAVTTDDGPGDVATVEPATPAASPPQSGQLTGGLVPMAVAPGPATVAVAGETVAVLDSEGLHLRTPGAQDPRTELADRGATAVVAHGGGFLAVSPAGLDLVAVDGPARHVAVGLNDPISVAVANDGRYLVGTAHGRLLVLDPDGTLQRDIHSFVRVDQILVAPESAEVPGQVTVIDRAQSSITPVDVDTGELKAALRAGNGVADAVVDEYGRVVASNTRDDEILGFFGQPIIMRFRFPVAHSPYALAYDPIKDLVWVSTTGDNQALAYDLSSGEPRLRARITTVGQVSSMAVDPTSRILYLVSEHGDGLQAVTPEDAGTR